MNKSEQRDVTRTLGHLTAGRIAPDLAAGALATIHRSALTKRTQREVLDILEREHLTQYLVQVNGCYVPRVAA